MNVPILRRVGIRDVGILMLGVGVFILALVALHFYLTEVLPHTARTGVSGYCAYSGRHVVIHVNTLGADFDDVNVYINGKLVCNMGALPAGSSDVCVGRAEGNLVVFHIVGVSTNRLYRYGGTCMHVGVSNVAG